ARVCDRRSRWQRSWSSIGPTSPTTKCSMRWSITRFSSTGPSSRRQRASGCAVRRRPCAKSCNIGLMSRLDPRLLLQGYANGIFPMADSRDAEDLFWVEPRQPAVIPLPKFHTSRSLRKVIRSGRFTVTRDRAFADVIAACAEREETWINAELEAAIIALHGPAQAP